MTIKEAQILCHEISKSKGWWDGGIKNRNILEIAVLLHSEISEFVEEIREGAPLDNIVAFDNNNKPYGCSIELADLAIRLFDTCEAYGIDLEKMIQIKCEYNKTRPYRHGNKIA